MITAINPTTGEILKKYEEMTPNDVFRRLEKAHHAFRDWIQMSFSERAALMKEASRVLVENQNEYARTMALEMGKPVTQGRAEVQKCAWVCEYYADHAEKMLEPEIIQTDNRTKYHRINGKIFSTTVSWFGRHNEPITRMNPY